MGRCCIRRRWKAWTFRRWGGRRCRPWGSCWSWVRRKQRSGGLWLNRRLPWADSGSSASLEQGEMGWAGCIVIFEPLELGEFETQRRVRDGEQGVSAEFNLSVCGLMYEYSFLNFFFLFFFPTISLNQNKLKRIDFCFCLFNLGFCCLLRFC